MAYFPQPISMQLRFLSHFLGESTNIFTWLATLFFIVRMTEGCIRYMKVDLHLFGLYVVFLYANCGSICIQIIYLGMLNLLKHNKKKRQPPNPHGTCAKLQQLNSFQMTDYCSFKYLSHTVELSTWFQNISSRVHKSDVYDSAICKWMYVCVCVYIWIS